MRRHDSCEGTKNQTAKTMARTLRWSTKEKKSGPAHRSPVDDSPLIPFWLSQPRHVFCFPCRVLCRVAEQRFLQWTTAARYNIYLFLNFRRAFLPCSPRVGTRHYGTQCLSLAFDLAMPLGARIVSLMYASFPRVSVNSTCYAALHSQFPLLSCS
jgi:hypothetical protein